MNKMVGIKYIGDRKPHVDNLYGTWLEWLPGQIHNVTEAVATKMAPHTDVYQLTAPVKDVAPVKKEDAEPDPELVKKEEKVEPEKPPPMLPNLETMTKDDLINYAQQHFNEKLSRSMKPETMRHRILSIIQAGRMV